MIYFDSGVIMRLVEGNESVRAPLLRQLAQIDISTASLITSRLSRLECRCKPLRQADQSTLHLYDTFFQSRELRLAEIDDQVIELATTLRARYLLKTPDAIHAATSIRQKADLFWTTDEGFSRVPDLHMELFPAV